MKTNKAKVVEKIYTHGGAVASRTDLQEQLTRSVQACLIWENAFYESGELIAKRIAELVAKNDPVFVAELAVKARSEMNLRHTPLFLVRELARHPKISLHKNLVKDTLSKVIQRADEMAEFISIYWSEKKQPLSSQVKKGLAEAFNKFSEYNFGKYKGEGNNISLRDAMFLVHPKPKNDTQAMIFNKIANQELATPDTWETNLSAGKDKKETFTRLMAEGKLGGLAFVKNLRNMAESGVKKEDVKAYAQKAKLERVLPFRFITAAKMVAGWEDVVESMMLRCLEGGKKIPGKTVLVVDVSGSMTAALSKNSEVDRLETAYALAILAKEMCEDVAIYATAGSDYARVHKTEIARSARRGFALRDELEGLYKRLGGGGIFLKQVMDFVDEHEKNVDQVIVLTDEQDCDKKCNPSTAKAPGKKNYIINLSSEKNGIAYGKFTHITGWSEKVLDYIREDVVSNQVLVTN